MKGENIANLDRYHYRSHDIGVIFQSFNLLPKYTALENVLLSMDIAKAHYDDKKQYAMDLLKKVALDEEEANRRILKLSGGQQQRVAIARALSYDPKIILADEPTGALDSASAISLMKIIASLNHTLHSNIFLVTHDALCASYADRVLFLKDGKIFSELVKGEKKNREFYHEILDNISLLGE